MTLINQDPASPFLSPQGEGAAAEEPFTPHDDSAEGMRRLRDPFTVNRGDAARTVVTDPAGPPDPASP